MTGYLPKSKRYKATVLFLGINFITFWIALFFSETSMTELGLGLAAINAPLYAYLYGETVRPSKEEEEIKPEVA